MTRTQPLIRLKKRPGYTLLELLVSVLIFSGIIILAIAAFARSANSASKSNAVRAQVQATRSVIDQVTNDLHYINTTDQVTSHFTTCGGAGSPSMIGTRLSTQLGCDELEVFLKYPGATGTNDLVWRLYAAKTISNRPSIYLYEQRGCSVNAGAISCPGAVNGPFDLLPTGYVADGIGGLTPVFKGIDVLLAKNLLISPYIKISFNLKPAANVNQACSVLAAGSCYTLDTSVVPRSN